jgi:hypothetical protein
VAILKTLPYANPCISDYIGGILTAAMYGRPLLREDKPSNLRFTVLNPPMFRNHEDFQAEYPLIHDKKQIADHFSLVRRPAQIDEEALLRHELSAMPHTETLTQFVTEG